MLLLRGCTGLLGARAASLEGGDGTRAEPLYKAIPTRPTPPLGYPLPCLVPSLGSLPGPLLPRSRSEHQWPQLSHRSSPRTRCRDLPVLIHVLPHASSLRAF